MQVKVINNSKNKLPIYAHAGDAGLDLMADFSHSDTIMAHNGEWDKEREVFVLFSGGRAAIPTGLHFELPKGYELHIRGRSGLAIKSGLITHFGTLDSGFRGECAVILFNMSDEPFEIKQGDRIGQAILAQYVPIEWVADTALEESDRGENGFGSSGI